MNYLGIIVIVDGEIIDDDEKLFKHVSSGFVDDISGMTDASNMYIISENLGMASMHHEGVQLLDDSFKDMSVKYIIDEFKDKDQYLRFLDRIGVNYTVHYGFLDY